MEKGFWNVFCNGSECSSDAAKKCGSGFDELINPYSYINHIFIISVDILILLIVFSVFIYKSVSTKTVKAPSQCQHFSPLLYVSAIFNGFLGLVYLGLGIWIIAEKLHKDHSVMSVHGWPVMLFQGFTWFLLNLTVSQQKLFFPHVAAVKLCSIVAFLLSGFICISSFWEAIMDNTLLGQLLVDFLSFPGGILFLFCCFKGHTYTGADSGINNDASYKPLPSKEAKATDEMSSNANVTSFAKSGFFSQLSFLWLNPLMKKGKEKILDDEDIPALRQVDQARTCYLAYMEQMRRQKKKGLSESPSILSVIISLHWKEILISGLFALTRVLTMSSGPLFLKAFIEVYEGNGAFTYESYALTVGLFLAKCLESLSERQWHFRTRLIGIQVRSMLSAAICQKQLRLSSAAKATHSPGEIVHYVTADAYRIGEFPYCFHQIWTTSVQLCLTLAIVYYTVGLATIASVIAMAVVVFASYPFIKLQLNYQRKLMAAQGKRLKAITEALANMKILKLYAWEAHFKNHLKGVRKEELQWISGILLEKAYHLILFWSYPVQVPAITFWTCYYLGIPLSASSVFTFMASLLNVQESIKVIPDVVGTFIEAKVSLDRIVKFLETPELNNNTRRKCNGNELNQSIFIRSTEISWETDSLTKATLRNINLEVKVGEKVAICGEVGCGKSTLLAAVLGEVPKINGTVQVYGKIAYVSQTAWIQSGTIQENILFGSEMDPIRYHDVLKRCSLVKDLEMLPLGDLTQIGERGVNLSGGQKQRVQLARALYQDADVYLLDDPFSAVDAHTATTLFDDCVIGGLSQKTVLLVTHQVDFLPAFNSILLMSAGKIIRAANYDQLFACSQEFQDLVNARKNVVGYERHVDHPPCKRATAAKDEIQEIHVKEQLIKPLGDQLIEQEEKETGDTGFKPYLQYLSHDKGFLYFSLSIISHIMFVLGQMAQSYWFAANIQNTHISIILLLGVYTTIGCIVEIFLFFRFFSIVLLGCGASKSIFSTLLTSIFRAPISFYDSTPMGRILSRVSSDLGITDLDVAFTMSFTSGTTIIACSNFAVLTYFMWPVLFVIIPIVYLSILLQRRYFASTKELMRINGTTKSSVASHLAESLAGAMTIRAFGQEERFFSKNLDLIDKNARPYFHNFSASDWLILRLELLSAIVLLSSTFSMALLHLGASDSGFIGMSLSYGLSLNTIFVMSIQLQCLLSNLIISVERLEQYMHIPSEAPEVIESNRPEPNWPAFGKVEICNLKVRYRPNAPLVLQGITCTIEGGQKIGIVGRTGSGKTTLISALFRLVEPTEGKIIIDDLNISTIGLHDLRSHVAIIPQDPTLFVGSVRYNLDPLSKHMDQEIWEVLEKCHLRAAIQEQKEGLNSLVAQDGANWSMGQRQLFCLGRALLQRSRILVLDEATASIDNATDSILQKTIRTEFADCTVLTVAHRIPTVMDSDMVLAMSDGKLAEYDEPLKLMNKEGSLFGQLVREYWSRTTSCSSFSEDW